MNKKILLALTPLMLTLAFCFTGVDDETLLRYARAQKSYREGGFSETITLLEGIQTFVPALVLKGKAEYFSGDPAAAENSFRRARRYNPGAAEAGLYLGRILRERGDLAAAEALTESLLADDPLDVRVLRLAADLAREGGRADFALAYLDRAAEASAESALVFVDRARARWTAGKGEDALEDLERARVFLPWDTPLVRSIENLESTIREVLR
ncbi:MAG: tetratricopeptide repeat protein [Treponema sp.]|jgi:tetratricopeptide (TPR) repeat protein|nr:tetratricopeptide repeat protein [Treponema sp.]